MQTFWDSKHTAADKYWLTGSDPEHVIKQHCVRSEFNQATSFLDIGVGLGGMSRYAKLNNKYTISCDVSQVALANLKNIADETHTDISFASRPVDLAVCHLVFQHCDNDTVSSIINKVKLNPNGILSIQFACLRPGEAPNARVKDLMVKGTHHLRRLDEIKTIIKASNKQLISYSQPVDYFQPENLRWYFCKLANANANASIQS